MNTINDEMITKIADSLDDAAMLYYDASVDDKVDNTAVTNYDNTKGRINFFVCLNHVIDDFLEKEELAVFDEETVYKINQILDELRSYLDQHTLNKEEVRRALLLCTIKGYKNLNFSLDEITPDVIGILFSEMISTMFETSDSIEALDCNFGVGNLAFTVLNHVNKRFFLTGIENQVLLADVAKHYADMIQEEVTINNQDALDLFFPEMNLVFSDLAKGEVNKENYHSELYDKGIRDFAYLMIEKYLAMDGYCRYIYLVENTFFQKDTKGIFKDFLLKNAHIEAFVCLPNSFFQKPEDAKAILILDNHPENHNLGTNVYVLPTPIQNFKQFQEIMSAIKEDIRRANE